MGNGQAPYTPPPPVEQPIKDSVAQRHEAAKLMADMSSGASRSANDLNEQTADNAQAITRSDLSKADALAPQARPTGPAAGRVRGPKSGASMVSPVGGSAVLTG